MPKGLRVIGVLWLGFAVFLCAYFANKLNFNRNEVVKWEGCLGRPISECKPPSDYEGLSGEERHFARPKGLPAGSALSGRRDAAMGFWTSSYFMVLVADESGRVTEIYPRRVFALL